MKVRDVMSQDPICCLPGDLSQKVAEIMRDRNVGSLPVVADQESRKLVGMITDRDLCCSVIANGLDPKDTTIERFISPNPVTCRNGENVEKCERAMQEHQLRRIPVVNAEGVCIWDCFPGGPGVERQAGESLEDSCGNFETGILGCDSRLTGVCSTTMLHIQRAGQVAATVRNPLLFLDGGADSAFGWQGQ